MARTSTDTSIPAPLRALGGWSGAEWFCPTVLTDDAVVGFTLPKLAGGRKQNFHLVERYVPQAKGTAGRARRRQPTDIGLVLDEYEVVCAASFRRPTLLFEAAPVLTFAELPLARLKIRAADSFRRILIQHHFRGCVLHLGRKAATAMLWPAGEAEITRFVGAALPPYPLHREFDQAEETPRPGSMATTGDRSTTVDRAAEKRHEQERRRLEGENNSLLRELADLRARVVTLQQSQSELGAMAALGLDDARLKAMLRLLHPDRHGNSEAANEAAKWVNNLRDILKASRAATS